MSATTARTGPDTGERTPAQWYCLLIGATLVLAGLLGFIANSEFETGSDISGDDLIIFEVNGIHNLVHIASGLVLLAASPKRASAKTVAIAFGVVYGLVTLIGIIDGDTVLGLFPVNAADHVLHLAISALGIASGVISSGDDREVGRTAGRGATGDPSGSTGDLRRHDPPGSAPSGEGGARSTDAGH